MYITCFFVLFALFWCYTWYFVLNGQVNRLWKKIKVKIDAIPRGTTIKEQFQRSARPYLGCIKHCIEELEEHNPLHGSVA